VGLFPDEVLEKEHDDLDVIEIGFEVQRQEVDEFMKHGEETLDEMLAISIVLVLELGLGSRGIDVLLDVGYVMEELVLVG
jgi:hypothetical protein